MNYETAYNEVTKLAAAGDLEGIQAVIDQATRSGMNPTLVRLLGTFIEAALLNLKAPKSQS